MPGRPGDRSAAHRPRSGASAEVPSAYWWLLALGWIGLGVVIDLGNAWVTGIATVAFGMAHAVALSWALPTPRARDPRLPVRTAGVVGYVFALAAATVILGVLAAEDGAEHPVTAASVVIAVALVCGGPRVVEASR